MRILITGGAGYIGSVLVHRFLMSETVDNVTVVDNFRFGQTGLASFCMDRRLEIVRGDVRDMGLMAPLAAAADVIIPLAAIVGAPACDRNPIEAGQTNYTAVRDLCHGLSNDQIVIYPNTNSGYGIGGEDFCTESSPLEPISVYGRTKCDAEGAVMDRENSVVFRLATVFGVSPRMRTDLMVNDFVLRAITDRSITLYEPYARRNFVHVRDVAWAFSHALDQIAVMRGKAFNCGDTRANMTKANLVATIAKIVPNFTWRAGEGEDPDKRDYIVSNERLERTGWRPAYTINQGIVELVKFYQMSGDQRFGNV